jgi:cellulose synthase/poly-beta-1,6-N-acetylglucosamine synthase-like glycosyltransferase
LDLRPGNIGYAPAHDLVILTARAPFVLLLNQDVELDPGFLRTAIEALDTRPGVAAIQGLVRRLGADGARTATIDTTGLEMHRDRRVVSRDQGRDSAMVDRPAGPVWGADGPAPLYRRSALMSARLPGRDGWEVLDRDFFAYKEDVDLAWRLRRLGWEAWYEPRALAWHARGASVSAIPTLQGVREAAAAPGPVRTLSWRNQRLTQVKNDPWSAVVRDLPWIARREVLSMGLLLLGGRGRITAITDLARHLPWAMRKRRALQRAVRRASQRA